MATVVSISTRLGALSAFYASLDKSIPGSNNADNLEHALDMVLHTKRAMHEAHVFQHDLYRNAKYSASRTRARRILLNDREIEAAKDGTRYTKGATDGFGYLTQRETPESIFIAHESERLVRAACQEMGKYHERCLHGMLLDEPTRRTAQACGISERTVKRIRQEIRNHARILLLESKAC